jgi:hypothetical protein
MRARDCDAVAGTQDRFRDLLPINLNAVSALQIANCPMALLKEQDAMQGGGRTRIQANIANRTTPQNQMTASECDWLAAVGHKRSKHPISFNRLGIARSGKPN